MTPNPAAAAYSVTGILRRRPRRKSRFNGKRELSSSNQLQVETLESRMMLAGDYQLTGNDLTVFGTVGDDVFEFVAGTTHIVKVNGETYAFDGTTVDSIHFEGNGGDDSITLTGDAGDDSAELSLGWVELIGESYAVDVSDVETVNIYTGGGVGERADLYDSPGDDRFIARPEWARLTGNGFHHYVNGFARVYAHADAGGSNDRAYLYDSSSADRFYGQDDYGLLRGDNYEFFNYAGGFDRVYAYGGTGAAVDNAYFFDSSADDSFYGRKPYSILRGNNYEYYNYAGGFDRVFAYASSGGDDRAYLYDGPANDTFTGYSQWSRLTGAGYYNYVNGFGRVYAYASSGSNDRAYLYDGPTDDSFYGRTDYGLLRADDWSFYNYANGFDRVLAYADEEGGGNDRAYLYDSIGDDRLYGKPDYGLLRGTDVPFYNYANGFSEVNAYANGGGADDRAYLYDSASNDYFTGRDDYGHLIGSGYSHYAAQFESVTATSNQGGTDTVDVTTVDYAFEQVGNWSTPATSPVELPRTFIDTAYAPPQGGTIWTVNAGDNLQAAFNAAQPGDIIEIEAGASFVGKFVLPQKTGNEWIYIRSSRHSELPPEGSRIDPLTDGHLLPKLVAKHNERWVVRAELGAHNYRFVGIEITKQAGNSFTNQLVVLGENQNGIRANSVALLPHDIVFDRVYVHGRQSDATREGIRVDGVNIAVVDSYISDIHEVGNGDTQAILAFNGAGPLKIVNNHLEAAGENILFGGIDPIINVANGGIAPSHPAVNCVDDPDGAPTQVCGLVPSDIEIRGNHFFKPLSWYANDPSFAGNLWGVKNLFEIKNAQRVLLEGNVFENNWAQAQTGSAFQLTPRNSYYSAPWSTIKDVTITKNIIKNSGSGINMLPTDSVPNRPSDSITRLLMRDNLIVNVNKTVFGGAGRLLELASSAAPGFTPANTVIIDHNTILHEGPGNSYLVLGDSSPVADNFVFTNNLTTNGQYGLVGSPSQYLINYLIENNASVPNNNVNAAGFVDYAGGDYRLADTSPYKNAGNDGRDLGADVAAVLAATATAISGN